MKRGFLKSFADSRKIKYGTVSLAFSALIIAIIIVLNSIVSILSSTFGWYADMTDEQIYTVTDGLYDVIDQIDEDIEIDIIFCQSRDSVESSYPDFAEGITGLAPVHNTALELSRRYDNINVLYRDAKTEYRYFNENFPTTSVSQQRPNENTVIIARRGEDGTYGTHYRICPKDSFYAADSADNSLFAYSAEMTYAKAILSLSYAKMPTVYFTTGHGESVFRVEDGSVNYPELVKVFENSGFNVVNLDLLSREFICECGMHYDINEINLSLPVLTCPMCAREYSQSEVEASIGDVQITSDAAMLVINAPSTDFEASEIAKIREYLQIDGSVMCFVNNEAEYLTELYGFLSQWGGVTVENGGRVQAAGSSSIGDSYEFRGAIPANDASSAYLSYLRGYSTSKPILNNSTVLTIDERYMDEENSGQNTGAGVRITLPLIQTGANAIYNGNRGNFNVMTVTSSQTTHENTRVCAYLTVCASADFASDEYLSSSATYTNDNILYSLLHTLTAEQIITPADVTYVPFESYDLDITKSQATTSLILTTFLLPAILIVTGAIVITRRKRK